MPELVFEIEGWKIEDWEEIFQTLSLDVAAPYLGRMGLVVPEGFVDGVRSRLGALRQQELDGSGALNAIPHLIEWLTEAFGTAFVAYLHRWGGEIFRFREGAALHLWSRIVNYKGSSRREPLPPPPPFVLQLREMLAQQPPLDLSSLGPASPWDRFVYEWRASTDYINPMVLVDSTIDTYDFRRAWMLVCTQTPTLASTLTPALSSRALPNPGAMAEVKAWGWLAAQQLRLPLDRLGDPGSWSPLPAPWAPV